MPSSPQTRREESYGRTVEVETPEQVVLGFELADLGSRFLALTADAAVLLLALGGLVAAATGARRWLDLPDLLGGIGAATLLLLGFVVLWGYFVYFEGFREGRTPGKKWTGLRVVHEGGHPLTLRGAAIRNLLRIVDVQPAITCLVGGVSMMLHPRTQRLGDMAAGTLVVRDRGEGALPAELLAPAVDAGRPRLEDAQFDALDRLVTRGGSLEPKARERLAERLADLLEPHLPAGGRQLERLERLHAEEARRRGPVGGAARRGSAQAARLAAARAERWRAYHELVERARAGGLAALPEEDVARFAELYRAVSADLARVRTYGGSAELGYTLERWVVAGHNLFHRPPHRTWQALRSWLVEGFPALVRMRWRPLAVAAAALFLPAIATYTAVRVDPGSARAILPAQFVIRAEQAPQRLSEGRGYVDVPEMFMPVMSSRLIANNVQVTFFAFATGIFAGLGTILLLAFNGVFLGAAVGLYDANGAGALIWSFVAPHGVVELTAVCIAGAAGIWMGSALVLPGRASPGAALVTRARESVALLLGTTLLLVLAGMIEGFVSPATIPTTVKLTIAAVTALALIAYLTLAGRGEAGRESAARAAEQ